MSETEDDNIPHADQPELEIEAAAKELDEEALARVERIVEALLLASDQPLSVEQLFRLLDTEAGLTKKDLRKALGNLGDRLGQGGVELKEVSSGFRVQVKGDYAQWVGKLWQEKPPRYSRALLETLALICYRQPITRGEVEDVRGVAVSSNILRTLSERGWIRELGVKEVPGRPMLFGTTAQFLDDFNLRSLDELPTLPEIKDPEQLDAALARLQEAGAELASADVAEAEDDAASVEAGEDESTTADAPSESSSDSDSPTVH